MFLFKNFSRSTRDTFNQEFGGQLAEGREHCASGGQMPGYHCRRFKKSEECWIGAIIKDSLAESLQLVGSVVRISATDSLKIQT